ncbi:probable splicing factor YJU2B isoform X2 [Zonotrichia leucophrys gambelii]|uniref:probable splicing factor YJU2B isoform X2 n=1 Tax=Zonotrichia leucophrys gambelii TaxID=257770 RepID=UPI0031400AFD
MDQYGPVTPYSPGVMVLPCPSPSQSIPVPRSWCWEPGDGEQVLPSSPEQRQRLATDAMFRLEHGVSDRGVLERVVPTLTRLQEAQSAWKDDFGLNSRLRRRFREEKKTLKEEEEEAAALARKAGLSIPLVREEEEDRRLAALLRLRAPDSYEQRQRLKRSEISQRSWFGPGTSRTPPQKLGLGAPRTPPGPPPTPAGLGIVRRGAGTPRDPPQDGGAPPQTEGTPPQIAGTPRDPPGAAPQDPPQAEETPRDPPQIEGTPRDPPQTGEPPRDPPRDAPAPSLVADYSDSGSESP